MTDKREINDDRDPWVRQRGEHTKAFSAFCVYRNQGPERSLQETSDEIGKSMTMVKRWSSGWNWVTRAALYDDHLDEKRRTVLEAGRLEMNERHIELSEKLQTRLLSRVDGMTDDEIAKLPMHLVHRLLGVTVNVERLARALPTENIDATIGGRGGSPILTEIVFVKPDAQD